MRLMRLNCKITAVQKIINNKINNKIRLILNKAYFIYTKAEERSGKKNYVIFITKKYTNFGLL